MISVNNQTIIERLKSRVNTDFYKLINDNNIVLKEKKRNIQANNGGAFEISVSVPEGFSILFELEGENKIAFLKIKNCADGVIIHINEDETLSVHIIECKSKLNDKEWLKVKKQFEGAMLRFKSICGIIDYVPIVKNITVYTAFREDKVTREEEATFFLGKGEVGNTNISNLVFDWFDDSIIFMGKKIRHKKLQLSINAENIGIGNITLI
ncbi:hypothetical protein [Niallia circulans]|uniref:Uncharacterized protein n=1 Tax=Niallia circulans TaxID=1397 RepID=A0A941GL49_NIACI|nr:hypothetical protein [Niallia circulans]MCB5237670.1 hypothetical protein [Niallia circulans]